MPGPRGPVEELQGTIPEVADDRDGDHPPGPADELSIVAQPQEIEQQEPEGDVFNADEWGDQALVPAETEEAWGAGDNQNRQWMDHIKRQPQEHGLTALTQPCE